jgi:Peptidase family M23/Divergent InlB B-repeat domain/CARDB
MIPAWKWHALRKIRSLSVVVGMICGVCALGVPQPANATKFRLPLAVDTAVHYYYDHDSTASSRDWRCGNESYDGHRGTDFSGGPRGKAIYAAAGGTVSFRIDGFGDGFEGSTDGGGFGNYVRLDHGNGLLTYYGHMTSGSVTTKSAGSSVICGEQVGGVGTSGSSTGLHLHFEPRLNGVGFDPFMGSCNLIPTSWWVDQGTGSPAATCEGSTQQLPDLAVTVFTAPSTGAIGGQITVSATVANVGAGSVGAYRLGFYLSTDTTITTSDTYLNACDMAALAAGASQTCTGPITIPSSLFPGTYYLGVFADDLGSVGESSRSNNTAYSQITLSGPTYTVAVSASPSAGGTVSGDGTFAAGSSRTVTATANSGYSFANWTENGGVVSSSASYSFTLNAARNLVANFSMASSTDPDIAALANTTQPVYWFYIAINNASKWYIVETTTASSRAVMLLKGVDPNFVGGIRWKPISNYPTYAGFPAAATNFSFVSPSADGRSITFGALSTSQNDQDIAALANTTQPVYWFYIAINNASKWYIVETTSNLNPAVMLLNSVDPNISGGIRWKPISNYPAFAGFPAATITFVYVTPSPDGRSVAIGGVK